MGADAVGEGPPVGARVGLVVNPKGRRMARARDLLLAELARRGTPPPRVLATSVERPGAEQARTLLGGGVDLVVVAGGDGTVREVVSVLAGSDVALAILPTGTANLFARNLGLRPRRPAEAVRAALDGVDATLDVGRAWVRTLDDRAVRQGPLSFLVMAGIGRDARTVAATGTRLKERLGWLAYLAAGAVQALRPAMPMTVDLGAGPRRTRTWTVLFGNCPRIPGGIAVFPQARPDDGLLDVLEVPLRGPWDWGGVAAFGLLGRPRRVRALAYDRTTFARVVPREPQPVQLDGDVVADVVELEIGLAVGALRVRVPAPVPVGRRGRASLRRGWPGRPPAL